MIELTSEGQIIFSIFAFFIGACVGSFLNVCILRMPEEQSIVKPRSRCNNCQTTIAWYDNIPLISQIFLRSQCRKCGTNYSWRYFVVELITAALFLLVWLKYGLDWRTLVYAVFVAGLILATFVDLDHMIIPDTVSLGGMPVGLALSALVPALHEQTNWWPALQLSFAGMCFGFGILWLVAILGKLAFRKDAMGFGDVKLLGAIGAFLGWKGVLFTIMISSLLGTVIGFSLIFSGQKLRQSKIPYGPYLAAAAILWLFVGPELWSAYLDWISSQTQNL